MSIDRLKKIFNSVSSCNAWTLQILNIKFLKRAGTIYNSCKVTLAPNGRLNEFVAEVADKYIREENGLLDAFVDVIEYGGSASDRVVYKMKTDNPLIAEEYGLLLDTISRPSVEINPLEMKARAYMLKGKVILEGVEHNIKLFSIQNPITSLQHKFWCEAGCFKEITDKVLSLRPTVDVVVVDDDVYMLTLAGENLFNMERSYKAVCEAKVQLISQSAILTDFEAFSSIATSGHNPRRFVSFNEGKLNELKQKDVRLRMAGKFSIPLDGDKFDTMQTGAAEKIVKLLCGKGMLDPFDDSPQEVAGARKWT